MIRQIGSSACLVWLFAAMQFVPVRDAAAFDAADEYIIFSSSVRNRSIGESRFTNAVTFIYGAPENSQEIFGRRGPNPSQTVRIDQSGKAVRFKSARSATVSDVQFSPKAGLASPILAFRINGAKCRSTERSAFRSCSGKVEVFKGRSSTRGRLLFTSDDGLKVGNGNSDVSFSYFYAP